MESNKPVRISKLMADQGLCSRREADHLISKGWVLVNGQVVEQLGTKASREAQITLSSAAKDYLDKRITIVLNKPVGYVSSPTDDNRYPMASSLITSKSRSQMDTGSPLKGHWLKGLAPAGRLDIDSKGLLVLTQDGQLARHIIGPQSDLEKEYLVWVASGLTPERSERLRHGLELDGRALKVAKVEFVDNRHFRMTLIEGRKRQIRRMCELVGLKVTGIRRVRVGPIQLGKLKEGTWRLLTPEEKVKLGNS